MSVTYTGEHVHDDSIRWGGNTDPRNLLTVGATYEVARVDEHSWHTRVYLVGIDGYFNSVWFKWS